MSINSVKLNTIPFYQGKKQTPVTNAKPAAFNMPAAFCPKSYVIPFTGQNIKVVKKNKEYKNLTEQEKKIIKAVLAYKTKNLTNQNLSAICKKLKTKGFDGRESIRICGLIRNLGWTKKIKQELPNEKIKDFAFEFRRPGDFKLAKIIARKTFTDIERKNIDRIQAQIDEIHSRGIFLPQTRIPKASEIKLDGGNALRVSKDGITNIAVRFSPDTDFEAIGFEKGTNSVKSGLGYRDNFHALVKMRSIDMIKKSKKYDPDNVYSFSYISPFFNSTFNKTGKNTGYFVDIDPANIGIAYKEDINTSFDKNFATFKDYILDINSHKFRTRGDTPLNPPSMPIKYFSDCFMQETGMGENEYRDTYRKFSGARAITDLEEFDRQALSNTLFNNLMKKDGTAQFNHNEIVAWMPKPEITGLYSPDGTIGSISKEDRKFAAENDIPIFLRIMSQRPSYR